MRPPNNNIVHRSLFTTHTHVYKISNFFTPFHVIKQNLISQDYKSHQWRLNQFFESLSFSVVKGNSTYIAQSERTTLGSNLPWTCRRIIPPVLFITMYAAYYLSWVEKYRPHELLVCCRTDLRQQTVYEDREVVRGQLSSEVLLPEACLYEQIDSIINQKHSGTSPIRLCPLVSGVGGIGAWDYFVWGPNENWGWN